MKTLLTKLNNSQTKKTPTTTKAFTLLEMLLVIAIIAILAGIVIIAINPGRQLASARNAQRASDLRALHSAVQQYYIDNRAYPGDLKNSDGTLQEVCDENGKDSDGEYVCINLEQYLVPTYMSAIPKDPQASSGTSYKIAINPTSKTPTLTAPKSLEYDMVPVQIGTTTLVQTGGEVEPCGDPTNAECWSDKAESLYMWSSDHTITYAKNETSGRENQATIERYWSGSKINPEVSNYPAFAYCDTLDEGNFTDWYLPAIGELLLAWNDAESSADTLFKSGSYWSSTENPGSSHLKYAWVMNTSTGRTNNGNKNNSNQVRCLR